MGAVIILMISLVACQKGDVLYNDPENPVDAPPSTMLTALEVNTIQNLEGDFARFSSMFSGQMAGATAQYQAFQNYDINEGDFNNLWVQLYSGTMQNARILVNTAVADNPYYAGIARILLALNLGVATDLWGDVPYSDAFRGSEGNFTALYDSQEMVLDSIQQLLDDAIADLQRPEADNLLIPGSDDVFYQGSVNSWVQAAWTLKARYANRLSLRDPTGSATSVLGFLENGFADNEGSLEAPHSSDGQNQWGAFQNQRAGNIVANKFFIDMLKANNDPRLEYYFDKEDNIEFEGADISQEQIDPDAAVVGPFFDIAHSFPILTYFEARFLEAEAQVRLGQDASTALNNAIMASVQYVTDGAVDGSSIATYTAGTATMEAVMTEKWKAMFGQIEPYNDYRRTGLPDVPVRPGSAGAIRDYIPRRYPTPQQERQNNPNAQVVDLSQPVWWATGN